MQIISDFSNYPCTNAAVLFADGSVESTVLAFLYADSAQQEKQVAQLTLLTAPRMKDDDGPLEANTARCINHMCEALQMRYPSVTIRQEQLPFSPPPFLFDRLTFQQNIAPFLRLTASACTYGSTLLAPFSDDGDFPGISSPYEIVKAAHFWMESLSIQPMQIVTPFRYKTKENILRLGIERGLNKEDLENTFDCEDSVDQEPCLICRRCIARAHALLHIEQTQRLLA